MGDVAVADLLLLIPSRGRPQNIARLAESMDRTCRADTQLVVGLDDDDPELDGYLAIDRPDFMAAVAPGMRRVVQWLNHLAGVHAGSASCLGHVGDDNVFETVGWDVRVIDALGRVPFCFADDKYPGRPTGTLCCHIFMRSAVVKALGYMGPPSIRHMYVDPVWMAWGQATGIEFLADVAIPHLHYSAGKSDFDDTYAGSLAETSHDLDAFNAYCASDLNRDIDLLNGALFSPPDLQRFKSDLNIPG